jgi:WD40 repeat protein/DNA polymerase III delta prime subunit
MGDDRQKKSITVGDIVNSVGVAIGDHASAEVHQHIYARKEDEQYQRNKRLLLDKVRRFWINGVLEKSLDHDVRFELGMENRPEMVVHPWEAVIETQDKEVEIPQEVKNLSGLFEVSDRSLLILGEPGSGKTITLLEMARELINKANNDIRQAIPVIFTLSTWGKHRGNLEDWLIHELNTKYQIPSKIGKEWIENQDLVLFLDGLDEVALEHRAACAESINQFRSNFGLTGIVTCCRIREYGEVKKYLHFGGAIFLQPLSIQQIHRYVGLAGHELDGLRKILEIDNALVELARSPLFLSIMMLAYRNMSADELKLEIRDLNVSDIFSITNNGEIAKVPLQSRYDHLFETFINRMINRRKSHRYNSKNILKWLSWLANQMQQNSLTVFRVEDLQPTWLNDPQLVNLYISSSRFLPWLVVFFIGVVSVCIFYWLNMLDGVFLSSFLIAVTLFLAPTLLTLILIYGVWFRKQESGRTDSKPDQALPKHKLRRVFNFAVLFSIRWSLIHLLTLLVAVAVLKANYLGIFLVGIVVLCLPSLLIGFLLGAFIGYLVVDKKLFKDIKTVDILAWSWKRFVLATLLLSFTPFLMISYFNWRPSGMNIWDLETGERLLNIRSGIYGYDKAIWNSMGDLITGLDSSQTARIISAKTGNTKFSLGKDISLISWSPRRDLIVTVDFQSKLSFFNPLNGVFLYSLNNDSQYIQQIDWSPDGKYLAIVTNDDQVKLLNADSRMIVLVIDDFHNTKDTFYTMKVAWSVKNFLLISECVADNPPKNCTLEIWDVETGLKAIKMSPKAGWLSQAEWSPDGYIAAVLHCVKQNSGNLFCNLSFQDATLRTEIESISFYEVEPPVFAWQPHGNLFALYRPLNQSIQIYEPIGKTIISVLYSDLPLRDISWSRNGKYLAVGGCPDTTICKTLTIIDPSGIRVAYQDDIAFQQLIGWSPDSSFVLLQNQEQITAIKLMSLPGKNSYGIRKIDLVGNADVNGWAPDSNRLATTTSYYPFIYLLWIFPGVIMGLYLGFQPNTIPTSAMPNWGIWLSGQSGLLGGCAFAVGLSILTITIGIGSHITSPNIAGFTIYIPYWLSFGVIGMFVFGGSEFMKHFLLRILLLKNHTLPWQLVEFLTYAEELLFLTKVGGSYMFIHRALLEHFAQLDNTSLNAQQVPK